MSQAEAGLMQSKEGSPAPVEKAKNKNDVMVNPKLLVRPGVNRGRGNENNSELKQLVYALSGLILIGKKLKEGQALFKMHHRRTNFHGPLHFNRQPTQKGHLTTKHDPNLHG